LKAAKYKEYGSPDVLEFEEVEKPTPKDNQVLIKIHATSVTYGDVMVRNMSNFSYSDFNMPAPLLFPTRIFFGLSKPKIRILGAELSGEVESVGKAVKKFKAGDRVFGYRGQNLGAYAEYVCMPDDGCLAKKPANMSYEEAAVVPYGAIMALGILRKVDIQPGQKILIVGASGGIGSAALQLVKNHFGAEVTGVCGTARVEMVKSLGADHVVDYTQEDFTKNGETYDLIIDILGKTSYSHCKNSLTENGRVLYASFKTGKLLHALWTKVTGSRKVICAFGSEKQEDLVQVKELIDEGKIKAAIDKSFSLEQAAEAHAYYEGGNRKGHIAITVIHGD
jgi:NADPH:quinone reductase-like Zn-dependent oxidoreductase